MNCDLNHSLPAQPELKGQHRRMEAAMGVCSWMGSQDARTSPELLLPWSKRDSEQRLPGVSTHRPVRVGNAFGASRCL